MRKAARFCVNLRQGLRVHIFAVFTAFRSFSHFGWQFFTVLRTFPQFRGRAPATKKNMFVLRVLRILQRTVRSTYGFQNTFSDLCSVIFGRRFRAKRARSALRTPVAPKVNVKLLHALFLRDTSNVESATLLCSFQLVFVSLHESANASGKRDPQQYSAHCAPPR